MKFIIQKNSIEFPVDSRSAYADWIFLWRGAERLGAREISGNNKSLRSLDLSFFAKAQRLSRLPGRNGQSSQLHGSSCNHTMYDLW
jgi:hypothetical protein